MKRFLIIPLTLVALAVAGCAQIKSAGDLLSVATFTVTNPISSVDIYRVKNVYAATLQLVVDYRKYCWDRSYAALMADPIAKPVCRYRRIVVRTAQTVQLKARSTIQSADNFVRNNPTLNASSVIGAAWQAVTDFQNAIPRVN